MAKRTRRPSTSRSGAQQPAATPDAGGAVETTATTTDSSRTTRTGRTSTRTTRARRSASQESPLARYRGVLLGGAAIIGVLIIGFLFFQSTGGSAYACESLLTPGPVESVTPRPPTPTPSLTPATTPEATASPAGSPGASPSASESPAVSPSASPTAEPTPEPEPTARLGFTTPILGANHVPVNDSIEYGFCPPTSGDHYNSAGRGPIRAAIYPPDSEQPPGGWVHNLEHGYVVLAYRCPGGEIGAEGCPTQEEWAQMQEFFNQAPVVNDCPNQLIIVRFDEMETQFGLLAWGRALLLDEFNLDTALTFAQQWTDAFAPENTVC